MNSRQALLGALIGLARTAYSDPHTPELITVMLETLAICATGADADFDAAKQQILMQKRMYAPNCADCASPCGRTADFDVSLLDGDSAKQHLLDALCTFGGAFRGRLLSPQQEQLLFDALGMAEEPHSAEEILLCAAQVTAFLS